MNTIRQLHLLKALGHYRTELYDGREHLVVPVIALMEGVIHAVNAATPEFVSAATLSYAPHGWNGRPLVLGHPVQNGKQISANDARVLEAQAFGQIFNARTEGTRLLMDAFIDPVKAEKIGGKRMLERIRNGEMIEVSVGAFVGTDETPGLHLGKPYTARWSSIAPDHLAFLPDGRGACSIEMGCGAVRNAAEAPVVYEVTADGLKDLGGKGSGNFDHSGRKGEIGGSGPGEGKDAQGNTHHPTGGYTDKNGNFHYGNERTDPLTGVTEVMGGGKSDSKSYKPGDRVTVGGKNYKVQSISGKTGGLDLSPLDKDGRIDFSQKMEWGVSPKEVGDDGFADRAKEFRKNNPGVSGDYSEPAGYKPFNPAKLMKDARKHQRDFPGDFETGRKWGAEAQPLSSFMEELDANFGKGPSAEKDASLAGYHIQRRENKRSEQRNYKPGRWAQGVNMAGIVDNIKALLARVRETPGTAIPDEEIRTLVEEGEKDCSTCDGTGQMNGKDCEACDGTGKSDNSDDEGDGKMKKDMKAAAIKSLTECPCSGFTTADVTVLEAMSDEAIETLQKRSETLKTAADKAKAELTATQDKAAADLKAAQEKLKAAAAKQLTEDEFLATAPESIRTLVADKKSQDAATKASLVAQLKVAAAGTFTEEELGAKSIPELQKLAQLAKVETVDFSGRGIPVSRAAQGEDFSAPDSYAPGIKALQEKTH